MQGIKSHFQAAQLCKQPLKMVFVCFVSHYLFARQFLLFQQNYISNFESSLCMGVFIKDIFKTAIKTRYIPNLWNTLYLAKLRKLNLKLLGLGPIQVWATLLPKHSWRMVTLQMQFSVIPIRLLRRYNQRWVKALITKWDQKWMR